MRVQRVSVDLTAKGIAETWNRRTSSCGQTVSSKCSTSDWPSRRRA